MLAFLLRISIILGSSDARACCHHGCIQDWSNWSNTCPLCRDAGDAPVCLLHVHFPLLLRQTVSSRQVLPTLTGVISTFPESNHSPFFPKKTTHTYIHTYKHICMYACIHTYTICTHTNGSPQLYRPPWVGYNWEGGPKYFCINDDVCMCACMCVCMFVCMYVCGCLACVLHILPKK